MNKKLIIILSALLLFSPLVLAECTVTLDKYNYISTETATATILCSIGNERSQTYTLNWTFNNGTLIESDSGTTPSTEESFFETFNFPSGSDYLGNVTLSGTNLEGTDTFNVTSAGNANSLLITNITHTSLANLFLGRVLGIEFTVKDENAKLVNNAQCQVDLEKGDGIPLLNAKDVSHYGRGQVDFYPDHTNFKESAGYRIRVGCFCGASGTNIACTDEDGVEVASSSGVASDTFTTNTWVTFNDDTFPIVSNGTAGNSTYLTGIDLVKWKRNVTNNAGENLRTTVKTYLVNNATGRIYGSPNEGSTAIEERTIFTGETSTNFNHRIAVDAPDGVYYIKLVFDVYYQNILVQEYFKETATFNVKDSNLVKFDSIFVLEDNEWTKVSNTQFKINESFVYLENATENLHDIGIYLPETLLDERTPFERINNYTITYRNGSAIPYTADLQLKSRFIEKDFSDKETDPIILVQNVNLSKSDNNFTITLNTHNFEERQTEALEGIENKTGTFHLSVECPSNALPGDDITCLISAQVEDSQVVQKEVDFTCYISDGTNSFNSLNFNQMINRTLYTVNKTIKVPSDLPAGASYVFQCEAGYYNLGSRTDYFYDSFVASSVASSSEGSGSGSSVTTAGNETNQTKEGQNKTDPDGSPITGAATGDGILNFGDFDLSKPKDQLLTLGLLAILLLVLYMIYLKRIKKRAHVHHYQKIDTAKVVKKFFVILISLIAVIAIVLLTYYGAKFLIDSFSVASPQENSFFKLLALIGFIVAAIIILFKSLGINGEIRFGNSSNSHHTYHDRKLSKMQQKLNHMVLKDELKRAKHNKHH